MGKSFIINFKREIWHVKPKLPLDNYFWWHCLFCNATSVSLLTAFMKI